MRKVKRRPTASKAAQAAKAAATAGELADSTLFYPPPSLAGAPYGTRLGKRKQYGIKKEEETTE